jgi:SAM-dependent methyltransferase
MEKLDYENAWNAYAQQWKTLHPQLNHIGDEWIGKEAGAANSLPEYESLIEQQLIAPYITPEDTVLEIGIGGGKTGAILLRYCNRLICADISAQMLQASQQRLGNERVDYIKLDGISLNGIAPASADICFCYDTLVHIEPRDIFNYLTQIPSLLRGKRLCIFHHANVLSELGWKKFLSEWDRNLLGRKQGTAFSVMTDSIMEKFLTHLGYEILVKNTILTEEETIIGWVSPKLNPTKHTRLLGFVPRVQPTKINRRL